jgi:FkbM family methyltransferase
LKTVLRQAIVTSFRAGLRLSGERGRRITSEALSLGDEVLYQTIEPVNTARGAMVFYCLGDLAQWRARTLLTKEPETIEWIDSFDDGDTFWDIGANIGIYSVYAAINRKVRVLAFEPSAGNYFLLNRNIEINGLTDVLRAFCLAFSDTASLDVLNMQSTGLGGALSSFGSTVDESGREFVPIFRQGMIGYSVDGFVAQFKPAFPSHLKIDVDGIEDRIILGAAATLSDARLKSISIELDASRPAYTESVIGKIEGAGLKFVAKRQSEMFAGGKYQHIFNYQFRRIANQGRGA